MPRKEGVANYEDNRSASGQNVDGNEIHQCEMAPIRLLIRGTGCGRRGTGIMPLPKQLRLSFKEINKE